MNENEIHVKAIVDFEVKEIDAPKRRLIGKASTWGIDLGDDYMHPGAFRRSIEHWRRSGKAHPLLDNHIRTGSVRSVVGKLVDAEENDVGVMCEWEIVPSKDGDEVIARVEGKFVDSLSIDYVPAKYDHETLNGKRVRNLREVKWVGTSIVIFPMQPNATADAVAYKALYDAIAEGGLTEEQKAAIRALVDPAPADEPEEQEPPRLALEAEAKIRADLLRLQLRRLAARS